MACVPSGRRSHDTDSTRVDWAKRPAFQDRLQDCACEPLITKRSFANSWKVAKEACKGGVPRVVRNPSEACARRPGGTRARSAACHACRTTCRHNMSASNVSAQWQRRLPSAQQVGSSVGATWPSDVAVRHSGGLGGATWRRGLAVRLGGAAWRRPGRATGWCNLPASATRHRDDVAHCWIFEIRSCNCPADACAVGGPPHTRRSSLWMTPCGCPLRWCQAATSVFSSLRRPDS